MWYPSGFPPEAQDQVVKAKIRGSRKFESRKRDPRYRDADHPRYRGAVQYPPERVLIEGLLIVYILSVWRVFLREATTRRLWRAPVLDFWAREFLLQLTIDLYSEKGFDNAGHRLPDMVSHVNGSILDRVMREFRDSKTWKYFEEVQLAVTKPEAAESVVAEPRSAFRFLDDLRVEFYGRIITLTKNQHILVKALYEAWDKDELEVHSSTLLRAVGNQSGGEVRGFFQDRNRELFQRTKQDPSGCLIIRGQAKGTYRLNLPAKIPNLN